ncbi:MAG: hypothetical protein LBK60_10605 [Verrucomicrobiales bacterium]|jgi:uncharacterized protein HemX|nr:hypothetical protein [Verrucomicrobiales bacterium]
MPPRHTRKKVTGSAPRRARTGNRAPLVVAALVVLALLAAAGFYLYQQERDKHDSIAAKARQIAEENPNAEVFSGDVNPDADVKKK